MFRQPTPDQHRARRAAERAANMAALCSSTTRPLTGGTYAGATEAARPKTKPYRDAALLEMARGRLCLLCPAGNCTCTPGSVVSCHSNWHEHGGRAKNRKADDCYSVWGGDRAHEWLDRSGAPAAEKEARFMAAHLQQVLCWRVIADDPSEPMRFRRAARRALDHLNATPTGELDGKV